MQTTSASGRPGQADGDGRLFRRIVVPLNGSATAERVLAYVQYLARWFGSEVTLLHVLFRPRRIEAGPDSVIYPDTLHDRAHSLATAYLSEIAREMLESGINPRTVVASGEAVAVIAAHTPPGAHEMTAMGTRGRSLLSRLWSESITEGLFTASRSPLFLVNSRLNRARYSVPPPPRALLVAVDGATASWRSIPYALEIATRGGLEVMFLHVAKSRRELRTAEVLVSGNGRHAPGRLMEAAEVRRRLEHTAARFAEHGVIAKVDLRHGSVADTIVEVQNELGGCIAMLTSRQRRGWRGHLAGTVADRVLHLAADPVLIIPGRGAFWSNGASDLYGPPLNGGPAGSGPA